MLHLAPARLGRSEVRAVPGYQSGTRDAEADLARQFPGVIACFGADALHWWARPRPGTADGVIAASSPQEMAQLLAGMEATGITGGTEGTEAAAADR